jgi:hypothetical protein
MSGLRRLMGVGVTVGRFQGVPGAGRPEKFFKKLA